MRPRVRQGRRRLALRSAAACGATAAALIAPTVASGGDRAADPLSLAPVAARPDAAPVRDRVIRSGEPPAAAASTTRTYTDADGHRIRVRVSDAYSNPDAAGQDLADFLGSLVHGDELDELIAQIATPGEIKHLCGAGALACYYPASEEIIVSGDQADPNQPPRELVIAHEYGHHVAHNRSNKPWSALARGTKRWSTYENVCEGIARNRIQPRRYWQNPGEAFAEAYAFSRFPDVIPWEWRIARPDQGAFDAILADVTDPWRGRTTSRSEGTLGEDAPREVSRVETPLDGRLTVAVDGPPRANFDLRVISPGSGKVLAASTGQGADEQVKYTVCGRRAVRIAVKRESGQGPFQLKVTRP